MTREVMRWVSILALGMMQGMAIGQGFYFGADLSYVNEMEDCGAVYKVNAEMQDPFEIFSHRGCNLVRLRLWHTPAWYDMLNQGQRYSDETDVRISMARSKAKGMDVLLAFHLSDTWADPSHQVAPLAWSSVLDDLSLLQDSLYEYMYNTLYRLGEEGLLPEIVQIGNETNKGILLSQEVNDEGWSLSWPRNSALFNTAIGAVRDIEELFDQEIKVALHIANPTEVGWYMQQFWQHDVRDFDIIGLSYYWQFHNVLMDVVGNTITMLRNTYPGKEVMILETAYPWTGSNADGANNILFNTYPGYAPHSPAHQRQWMIDLTQEVIDHGGKGVIYWEPGWVSTDCRTQWAQGSHWDNATFFNWDHEIMDEGGMGWMLHMYNTVSVNEEGEVVERRFSIYYDGYGLWLYGDGALLGEVGVQLYAMDGRRVIGRRVISGNEGSKFFVGLPEMSSGIYVVVVDHGELTDGIRVVIW